MDSDTYCDFYHRICGYWSIYRESFVLRIKKGDSGTNKVPSPNFYDFEM